MDLTPFYISTGKDKYGKIGGALIDLTEVGINQFGGGVLITQGVSQDREFIDIVTGNAKLNNKTVTLSGHSAGGRRNFTNILSSNYNQYLNDKGQSILNLQFVGSPTNLNRVQSLANYTGANLVNSYNNSGDFVGNVLGNNGGNSEVIKSTLASVLLLSSKYSPHSNYYCHPAICNFSQRQPSLNNDTSNQ